MSRKNMPASVRQRLLNLSRQTGEDFQLLLTRYAIERVLYRISASEHAGRFVLKGAMLFALWTGKMHRPTRDLDLLGFGDSSPEHLAEVFRSLCAAVVPNDGLIFSSDSVKVEAMVKLGLTNSRMKDFYDLLIMARTFTFAGSGLCDAIRATFARRGTTIPTVSPIALTETFAADETKRKQWLAFRKRNGVDEQVGELEQVVAELAVFLDPPLAAARTAAAFSQMWKVGGPWESIIP